MYELLGDKYSTHTNVISRVSHYLVTESDVREFTAMVADLYETAYSRALKDYHAQIEATTGMRLQVSYGKPG
jgi:hypothetical protein